MGYGVAFLMRLAACYRWWVLMALGCGGGDLVAATAESTPPLRVGTMGDPPPFSIVTDDGYSGIDIELAEDLARELGRRLVITRTTWRTLVADAEAGQFDLAMSGINVTESRSASLDFSRPYADGARIAVVRCDDVQRFGTLEDLNRPEVTIVAQTGTSTLETVREHLPLARVAEYESTEAASLGLLAGEGDVLVGTVYRHVQHSGLCATLGGETFFPTSIAVAFPKGSELVAAVDQWLARRLEDGTVSTLLRHYGFPGPRTRTWTEAPPIE